MNNSTTEEAGEVRKLILLNKGGPPLQGVAVMRYPSAIYELEPGAEPVSAATLAMQALDGIGSGGVLLLPSDRDEHGHYLWDFRIEGGDQSQVEVQRSGDDPDPYRIVVETK